MATRKGPAKGHERVGRRGKKEIASRARARLKKGQSPKTAASEFVHEEIHHVRQGEHGAKSPKQAIAIGLSKARRAGVPIGPPPQRGRKG